MRSVSSIEGRRRGDGRVSHDRWLVSYADFITLLFAFFTMMYAASRVDARKLESVALGMREAFDRAARPASGVLDGGGRLVPEGAGSVAAIEAAVRAQLAGRLAAGQLDLGIDRRGVILSIPEAGTFPVGDDQVSPGARALVAEIAASVAPFPNAIRVEGHADSLPINTVRFRSNWDLSAARASRVVELLIAHGVAPSRLAATGYAEFQPRRPNDTDADRAANRRVDLVILQTLAEMPEPPAER